MTLDLAALSIDPEPLDPHRALLDAGKTLASVADPDPYLGGAICDIQTVGTELKRAVDTLQSRIDRAYELYETVIARGSTVVDIFEVARLGRAKDIAQAQAAAVRACKRQLVELASVISQMEETP